ncbi:hypothetical protein RJ640_011270 [Escallonia rubra]|uniref:Exostosin GT47 domain-containing protein n=1 Tax=Escallonia rubra TaxID=112253 RepID=A0AA88UTZ9_9ASTE|nr:hypothetical protein RJ640_011270 [Escallonia rubra]
MHPNRRSQAELSTATTNSPGTTAPGRLPPPIPAAKPQQPPSAAAAAASCSIHALLIALLTIALVSLAFLAVNSYTLPLHYNSCITAATQAEELANVYHSPEVFRLNYAEMEAKFKVYVYPDGDASTFYQTPRKLTGKYSSEGYFFQNIRESRFRTDDPNQADLFFIPVSCHKMRGKGTSYENMTIIVHNYVEMLMSKYPFWNRTLGADHFFVTCHDVGVRATEGVPLLVKNSIRAVCSPSYNVGFIPHKDVALPQILQPFALPAGGNDIENRASVLLEQKCSTDPLRSCVELIGCVEFDFQCLIGTMRINSARIADSIHYGCIPGENSILLCSLILILSDYYDLPFNDILDWQKFSIILKEREVKQLKQLLKGISGENFVSLHQSVVQVQKHFQWNSPPIRYDAFHMVMYDLWLRRHAIKY